MADYTPRHGFRLPERGNPPGQPDDLVAVQSDVTDNLINIDEHNSVHVCTSLTRPTVPTPSMLIFEEDTQNVRRWGGSTAGWVLGGTNTGPKGPLTAASGIGHVKQVWNTGDFAPTGNMFAMHYQTYTTYTIAESRAFSISASTYFYCKAAGIVAGDFVDVQFNWDTVYIPPFGGLAPAAIPNALWPVNPQRSACGTTVGNLQRCTKFATVVVPGPYSGPLYFAMWVRTSSTNLPWTADNAARVATFTVRDIGAA